LQRVETDRFGRTVAHVFCDGIHANWRQVEDGLAWCFTRYLRTPAECLPREQAARAAGRGLWRDAAPTAPWAFREHQRKAARN
jgi:endonuclease YncB( thermonuclease family)